MSSRRDFLKLASLVTAASAFPFGFGLGSTRPAFAATPEPDDYKALICVFLFGGSDYANTLIPLDGAQNARYLAARGGANGIGVPRQRVLEAATNLGNGYGLSPALKKTAALYRRGNAAVIANIGALVEPIERDGDNFRNPYTGELAALPDRLRSHNDQQATVQSFAPEIGDTDGWGGRFCDEFVAANRAARTFASMSSYGANAFGVSARTVSYQVIPRRGAFPGGALKFDALTADGLYGSAVGGTMAREILTTPRDTGLIADHLTSVRRRSVDAEAKLARHLERVSTLGSFPTTPIGNQLEIVARSIQAGIAMGLKRQVFFVAMGGFDHHDNLYSLADGVPEPGTHEALLSVVDDAIDAMYAETVARGLANKVTMFTMSDFGRTLSSNGDGTDHGWGGHQLVVGGAVRGNATYGRIPVIGGQAPDPALIDRGVLMPTTSVQELAACLGRWFGIPQAELLRIIPNLAMFDEQPPLEFMRRT